MIYPGFIASLITRFLPVTADQHQANGAYGVHQVRCRLPNDPTTYRIIIAPADAPIFIGKVPVDQHFIEPI
jgi:hypothetical protein